MSEGWEDCPVLPVGWKRREVYRRSGATIGKSDTYYMSPTAERFRSKVELIKYFGDSLDLTYFDFKKGIILPPNAKIRKAVKRSSTSSCELEEEQKDRRQPPKKKAKLTPSPAPAEVKVDKAGGLDSAPLDTLIVCCEGCQQWVPGVVFGARKRRFKFYCAECRARRRELGRQLNYYKRFGCGECAGCTVTEDCGICRGCMVRISEPTKNWKCVKRRCQKLKEIKAQSVCRSTAGKPKKKAKLQFQEIQKAMKKVKPEGQVEKKPPRKIKTEQIIKAEEVAEEKALQKPRPPIKEEKAQESQIQLKRLLPRELLGQSQWPDWKEPGYRSGRRRCKENAFASRKVARVIQAARKRKIWQSSAQAPEAEAVGKGRSESAERAAESQVEETAEAAESWRGRTESAESGQEKAEEKVGPSSAEKPLMKGASSEAHDRPSVIKETSEWQLSGSSSSSEQARRTISEMDTASHRSVSPLTKQQDNRERHTSRKAVPLSTKEPDLKDVSTRIMSPVTQEEDAEPASTNRQPLPAKRQRPTESEVPTSGVPSNSQIIRRGTPGQNPGYGRSTPASITQIFSLGSPYMMMTLEPLLRNFMQDLMVMPLPASWVVCSSLGPDVQLIQLSRKSPVSDAVVQIRPGFFFHVLVRGLPVPLGHRLYRSHPAQLTTVDDVVDLIGDLETYRVCAGYPQLRHCKPPPAAVAALLPRERSSYCEVLVDKDRCFQCAVTL